MCVLGVCFCVSINGCLLCVICRCIYILFQIKEFKNKKVLDMEQVTDAVSNKLK